MKYMISFIIATQVFTSVAFAGSATDKVLKVLKTSSKNSVLSVAEDTYVFNINGYGCQWPGLRISNAESELNHNRPFAHFGSDADYLAIGIKDPNHQFCDNFGDAASVFGKEFVPGAELPIKTNRVLDLRNGERMNKDGNLKLTKLIHETITIQVNGRLIESTSEINLEKN